MRAVLWFRVAYVIRRRRWTRPLALWVQDRVLAFSGAEIHPAARIGPGFLLVHSAGVLLGDGAEIRAHSLVTRDVPA